MNPRQAIIPAPGHLGFNEVTAPVSGLLEAT